MVYHRRNTVLYLNKYSKCPIYFSLHIADGDTLLAVIGRHGHVFHVLGGKTRPNHQLKRRKMMDTRHLKKVLATFGLAGLLAGAGLTLPGCAKHPPEGHTG
jgi:radical SAM modification target selenobiotic family peptide